MITIKNTETGNVYRFRSEQSAGAWLRSIGWPLGLVYAPDEDRVGLAKVLQGSPFEVTAH